MQCAGVAMMEQHCGTTGEGTHLIFDVVRVHMIDESLYEESFPGAAGTRNEQILLLFELFECVSLFSA
jgi:hypothetical protein